MIFPLILISGCGGPYYRLHPEYQENSKAKVFEFDEITLKVGEKKLVVEQTFSIMWGGWTPGCVSGNSDVVDVVYIENGSKQFYIHAKSPGEAVIDYTGSHNRQYFRVRVID